MIDSMQELPAAGGREGFGLVETVVGLLLGTVAILALAAVMITSLQVQVNAASQLELTALAESTLDQLRAHAALATSDTTMLSVGGSLTTSAANHCDTITSAQGRAYVVRWQVSAGLAGTRDVTVRVRPVTAARIEVPFADARTVMLIR